MLGASVSVEGIKVEYGNVSALKGVDLHVEPGECLCMLGPSGCGKTTLLNTIAGFIKPSDGRVRIDGKDATNLSPRRRQISMVFQQYALFPHMTVAENVGYGLRVRSVPRAEIVDQVRRSLALVSLDGYQKRRIWQLSGGEQQRVAVARALAVEPKVLLMDEPLSNLDAKLRREMRVELRLLQERIGTTVVFVTHDQEEALTLADRVAVMNAGRIEQVGTPVEVYRKPGSRFVAGFVGQANLLEGEVGSATAHGSVQVMLGNLVVHAAEAPAAGEHVAAMIRPEKVRLNRQPSDSENCFPGTIDYRVFLGSGWQYGVTLEAGVAVMALGEDDVAGERGEPVWVTWAPEDVLVTPMNGRR